MQWGSTKAGPNYSRVEFPARNSCFFTSVRMKSCQVMTSQFINIMIELRSQRLYPADNELITRLQIQVEIRSKLNLLKVYISWHTWF